MTADPWVQSAAGPGGTPMEERFRTIFEQSPVSTQIFAPDGAMLAANPAWERRWGISASQLVGRYNVLADEQLVRRGLMPYIQRAFAGEAVEMPAIKYVADETVPGLTAVPFTWVRASMYPVKDDVGNVREVVLMHEDITEQVQAEEAMRESERRFHAIFDDAPVGISLLDADGRYLAANAARQEMLGYTEAELVGYTYEDLTHPDDLEFDRRVNAEARQLGKDRFQLEKRFRRKDGTVRWARITASMVRDAAGEHRYSISIAEDITEAKEAEEERARLLEVERSLRTRSERLAAEQTAILSQIAEGIVIANHLGGVTFANESAREIFGRPLLDVPIDRWPDEYQLETADGLPFPPRELPLARALIDGETVVDAVWHMRRPDGSEVVAQGSAAPVVAPDGGRLGAVLTMRNITQQYDLERQMDEFLSAAAHDLRTPLTTIKGRLQLIGRRLRRGIVDSDSILEDLERIDGGVTRMMTLINDLLDVANLRVGRQHGLAMRPADLVDIVRRLVLEHQQTTDRHLLTLHTNVDSLVAVIDASRIERVLANLLSNAVKYSPEGGEIQVSVRKDPGDGWAVLTVHDEGVGIPRADLVHIFERFHRAANVTGRISGTGIGLSAVRQIVEQHGGTVGVQSVEGEGSTFIVRLPTEAPVTE